VARQFALEGLEIWASAQTDKVDKTTMHTTTARILSLDTTAPLSDSRDFLFTWNNEIRS
jgi:hypothetical protein